MTNLESLLSQYEHGSLTRRDLLAALALLVAAPAAASQAAAKPIGAVKAMNHVTCFVPDVKKSVEFYQSLFGMPILTRQDAGINLSTGNGFFGLYPGQASATGGSINHVCFGLDNFDADAVLKQLADRGIKGNIRLRGDTKELYFTDPDGLRIQLQDVKYIGGTGVLGDKPPK